MNNNVFIEQMVCRHFKGGMYCTVNYSTPVSEKYIDDMGGDTEVMIVMDSERDFVNKASGLQCYETIIAYKGEDGQYHHNEKVYSEDVALYVSLQDGRAYGRPMSSFLSKVDTEKYPDADQEYRFQYVCNSMRNMNRENIIFSELEDRVNVMFGDGKLRLASGYSDRGEEGKFAVLAISEHEDVKPIGTVSKGCKRDDFEPPILFAFKNEAGLQALIDTLEECRKVFNENEEVVSE